MLIRISLVIAIVAALAVGGLNFVKVKEKITTLIGERNDWHGKFDTSQNELAGTRKDLDKTKKELTQTQETLQSTTAERDKAVVDAAAQTKKAGELAEKLARTTTERDDARTELGAFKATGQTPEQISNFAKTIKKAELALEVAIKEKEILTRDLVKKTAELAEILEPDYKVRLPANLKGKILVADPKWDFVVLDFGEDKHVLLHGELLVNRNGKLVAKVRIHSIQKDRCIANLMPGWKLGDVMEGDQVIPAYPES